MGVVRRTAGLLAIPALATGVALGPGAGGLEAQAEPGAGPPAGVVPRVVAAADTAQSYALFVPAEASDGPRPLLVVMDPRGRALHAMERFLPAARELGWIVASARGTRSDTDEDPNRAALGAVLDDVQRRAPVDGRRLYLAGFSGTARFAWAVSGALGGSLAGIVSVGAGPGVPPVAIPVSYPEGLAVHGAAGRLDFNFEEMQLVEAALDGGPLPHRFTWFEGRHAWLPGREATEALGWLELQARRRGLAPADSARTARLHRDDLVRVDALLAEERPLEAARLLDDMERDYDGLLSLAEVEARRARIDGRALEAARAARARHAEEYRAYETRLRRFLARLQEREEEPSDPAALAREVAERLELAELGRRAGAGATPEARHAGRMFEAALVLLSFYEPRVALEAGRPALAEAFLRAADSVRPSEVPPCRRLERLSAEWLPGSPPPGRCPPGGSR